MADEGSNDDDSDPKPAAAIETPDSPATKPTRKAPPVPPPASTLSASNDNDEYSSTKAEPASSVEAVDEVGKDEEEEEEEKSEALNANETRVSALVHEPPMTVRRTSHGYEEIAASEGTSEVSGELCIASRKRFCD